MYTRIIIIYARAARAALTSNLHPYRRPVPSNNACGVRARGRLGGAASVTSGRQADGNARGGGGGRGTGCIYFAYSPKTIGGAMCVCARGGEEGRNIIIFPVARVCVSL